MWWHQPPVLSDKSVSHEERIPSLGFLGMRRLRGATSEDDAFGVRGSGGWGVARQMIEMVGLFLQKAALVLLDLVMVRK
jgi:hypothetical protein